TVMPPRAAWASTASTAAPPVHFTQRRESLIQRARARMIVRIPTAPAIMRWPCSNLTPPTMRGIRKLPKEVGQSGTDRPASLPVTSAPAIIRRKVQTVTKIAYRCNHGLYGFFAIGRLTPTSREVESREVESRE